MTKLQVLIIYMVLIGLCGLMLSLVGLVMLAPDTSAWQMIQVLGYTSTGLLCLGSILAAIFPVRDENP